MSTQDFAVENSATTAPCAGVVESCTIPASELKTWLEEQRDDAQAACRSLATLLTKQQQRVAKINDLLRALTVP